MNKLKDKVKGKRILLVRAKVARDIIPVELRKAGADIDVVEAYETVLPNASRPSDPVTEHPAQGQRPSREARGAAPGRRRRWPHGSRCCGPAEPSRVNGGARTTTREPVAGPQVRDRRRRPAPLIPERRVRRHEEPGEPRPRPDGPR